MTDPLDGALSAVEEAVCPRRVTRILTGLVVLVVFGLVGITIIGIAHHLLKRADAVIEASTVDRLWFDKQMGEILATEAEIYATDEALVRHQLQAETRWISRESDMAVLHDLSMKVVALTSKRAKLIADYNAVLGTAPPEAKVGLAPIVDVTVKVEASKSE